MENVPGRASPAQRQLFEPEMVRIPAGEFLMGSDPKLDQRAQLWEQPRFRLELPEYYLARAPVTNAQFAAFVRDTGHRPPTHWENGAPAGELAPLPVVFVSWYDAVAYCHWLSEVTGVGYCLPSEAEWEKGARGTDGRIYPWGDQWEPGRCNTREAGPGEPTPVGLYPQGDSPYGLLDMAGNVYEWTRSLWGPEMKEPAFPYPYDPSDGREELEAGRGVMRVLRGGAFYYNAMYARTAHRVKSYPDYGVRTRGFRVCCDLRTF